MVSDGAAPAPYQGVPRIGRVAASDAMVAEGARARLPSPDSSGSIRSIGSSGSILCIGSSGSILSIGSSGSILSIGSAGSVLSIGSVASAASIASAFSFASVLSVLSAFTTGRVVTFGALAGVAAAKLSAVRRGNR